MSTEKILTKNLKGKSPYDKFLEFFPGASKIGAPNTITFDMNYGDRVAELYLNEEGKLAFRGDVDDAAAILFEHVCKRFNEEGL